MRWPCSSSIRSALRKPGPHIEDPRGSTILGDPFGALACLRPNSLSMIAEPATPVPADRD